MKQQQPAKIHTNLCLCRASLFQKNLLASQLSFQLLFYVKLSVYFSKYKQVDRADRVEDRSIDLFQTKCSSILRINYNMSDCKKKAMMLQNMIVLENVICLRCQDQQSCEKPIKHFCNKRVTFTSCVFMFITSFINIISVKFIQTLFRSFSQIIVNINNQGIKIKFE